MAYYIVKTPFVVSFLSNLGNLGYPATFIAGLFFSYGLTTAPATAAIYNLGLTLNPFLIAFIGAFGSVISDFIIFKFVKNRLANEIKLLATDINRLRKPISSLFFEEELIVRIWKKFSKSKIWAVIVPVIGGFIIASPLPDEIGVAMFGAIKFNTKKFLIISYLFNFIGILLIALSTNIFG